MSFFRDLNLPVITYVARPLESRKGLQTFLDAIEELSGLTDVPPFSVWIIGGSPMELEFVGAMLRAHPHLTELHRVGRIVIWGRIGHHALAEFEARSAVVVMPSTREQFPITTIEVMMCGTPVIASNVDGFVDSVAEGETGTLLHTVDDAELLANALTAYLRNPPMRTWYGETASRWSRFAFSRESTFARFEQLYRGSDDGKASMFDTYKDWQRRVVDDAAARVAELLHRNVRDVVITGAGPHACFTFRADGDRFFAKQFSRDPTTDGSLFLLDALWPPRTFAEYEQRCRFLSGNDAAIQAVAYDSDGWLIVFEYGDAVAWAEQADLHRALSETARSFRRYRPLDPECADVRAYRAAARDAYDDANTIAAFDALSAGLNGQNLGLGVARFSQTHPQVELRRFQRAFARNCWSLPPQFVQRASALIGFVLDGAEFVDRQPELSTGSAKAEHLLRAGSRIAACDLDSVLYRVGPADEGHYLYKQLLVHGMGPAEMMQVLTALLHVPEEQFLALCWCVNDTIYDAVARLVEGNPQRLQRFMRVSHGLFEQSWPLLRKNKALHVTEGLQVQA
jgi:hypothetical protein